MTPLHALAYILVSIAAVIAIRSTAKWFRSRGYVMSDAAFSVVMAMSGVGVVVGFCVWFILEG